MMADPHQVHASIVAVNTKHHFRRTVPKTCSYRYEIMADAGPDEEPLVRAGAAVIDGHYRGRQTVFSIARSMVESETYAARGGYVHPLEENPLAYPPRAAAPPAAAATPAPLPMKRRDAGHATPANEPAAYRKTG